MGKNVYEIITERIMDQLEKGTVPWHKPWGGAAQGDPQNLISKKPYHGINYFLTACQGYSSPYWLTYKQASEMKGSVRKGEKGTPVIYWNWIQRTKKESPDSGEEITKNIPFLRYYTVFNSDQCDLPEGKVPSIEMPNNPLSPIESCEKITSRMPKRPEIRYGEQRAYYRPSSDSVNMPKFNTFNSAEEFYSTLFHELTHSTGHASRLNRSGITELTYFGSCNYSKEELVAEMGAAFLCGHVGIENKTIDNSASYINSWLSKLKNDKKLVIVAAAQAQKAADYILDKKPE